MIDAVNNRPAVVIFPRFAQMLLTPNSFRVFIFICGKV